jgi:putative DNA primase/helicase
VQPVPCEAGDVAPMLRLLRHLCSESVLVAAVGDAEQGLDAGDVGDVDAVMHWVLCWMAYPHQHIGAKMRTALVFHGSQGTGKNLFFDLWRDTFGDMGKTVGQTELDEKYNTWLSRSLAIVGDEVVSKQEL